MSADHSQSLDDKSCKKNFLVTITVPVLRELGGVSGENERCIRTCPEGHKILGLELKQQKFWFFSDSEGQNGAIIFCIESSVCSLILRIPIIPDPNFSIPGVPRRLFIPALQ